MNIVEVKGPSMHPTLVDGDLLRLKRIDADPSFGSLVLAKNSDDDFIVHRYLGRGRVKGDRVKNFDEVKSIDFVVVSRLRANSEQKLGSHFGNVILGLLSLMNQRKFTPIHYPASLLMKGIGFVQRLL